MAKRGRPSKNGGAVYQRSNSEIWQVRYKDQKGEMIRESLGTTDRQEAERFLRDRLDARDEGRLSNPFAQQATHIQRVGRLVSGEALQAAVSECWQSQGEPECPEISGRFSGRRPYRISLPKGSETI
jgi:hypothetical protein